MKGDDMLNHAELLATPVAARIRWVAVAGREHGEPEAANPTIVFLHGLTFDRRMWYPVLDALPAGRHAIAFDLPGHGGSRALGGRGLAPVVEALHDAILEAGLDSPLLVGHSIGGPIAAIYASLHPSSGVVSVDAPIRFEPFAEQLRALGPVLAGAGFDETWANFRQSWGMERLTDAKRESLHETASRELVLQYQADLLERPLDETIRWRDEGLAHLGRLGTPYLALQTAQVEPAERALLAGRVPQAEIEVWPVGHHFPHVAEPARFVRLLDTVGG
jgi:pimeloyl-ACP methyl ester carboxylesterase